jgi:small conductance mechanosensitive channel
MNNQNTIDQTIEGVSSFVTQANPLRSILILIASVIATYWLTKFVAKAIIKTARFVAIRSDSSPDEDKVIRLRQVETYLSVSIAAMRLAIAIFVGVLVWQALSPGAASGIAAIGAGTFFIVFAGQTLGSLLRDITAGATMIVEKWFNIGDYIKIEPFPDVSGVVERLTLRSTRVRSISGEVVWVHNQHIMAVHVTPRGVRTMAVDVFARDRTAGEKAIERIIDTVPTGPTLLAQPLRIKYAERWDDDIWRLTVIGEMPPGREWLLEKFFINALKGVDEGKKPGDKLFIYEPIARYADPEADKKFQRAVRIKKDARRKR